MTKGNLIPASNYLGSQSPEECQETAKTDMIVSIVKHKEIIVLFYKEMTFEK